MSLDASSHCDTSISCRMGSAVGLDEASGMVFVAVSMRLFLCHWAGAGPHLGMQWSPDPQESSIFQEENRGGRKKKRARRPRLNSGACILAIRRNIVTNATTEGLPQEHAGGLQPRSPLASVPMEDKQKQTVAPVPLCRILSGGMTLETAALNSILDDFRPYPNISACALHCPAAYG